MNILQTSCRHQRGAAAWTIIGSLLVVAGVVGLGVALIKPGSKTASIASATPATPATQAASVAPATPAKSVVTRSSAAAPMAVDTKPAAPVAAPAAASTAVAKTDPPGSGPHPNWHGTWRGEKPDARMLITAARVGDCKWITATDPRFDSDCESGYAKSSVSLADISRRYEESVALFQRDPSDFSISDPAQSRRLIGRIKPGNYRVIWMDGGSDCGRQQLIIDGDLILGIVECKYRHEISMLSREGVAPPAVAREVQGSAGKPVAIPLPGGRWEGTVNQPGFGPYAAVMQLQATPAGVPAGTMAYASLRCTASLSFMENEGNKVWFREAIQEGKGKCVDGGRISISPMSNESLLWQYFGPGNLSSPMATATFRR